ncbi:MAG: hypothetical protein KA956_01385 [Pyrinomonadaceae bacterium]|nr:hypothetical protein [Pyrinomonadaceae bacterium]
MNYFNYFTEIEDTFIRRRGKNLFLSPIDWALIESWQDRGIPMHIVIRSIESVFDIYDKQPPGTRSIKSLFYCRDEIEVQYAEWSRSQAGKSDGDDSSDTAQYSTDEVAAHITKSIATLAAISNDELKEDISRAIARLEELKANLTDNFESIDGTLSDIEKLLERSMLTNWNKPHLKLLEKETAASLKAYKAEMEPDAYKNTFNLMLLKRLREEAGVPRLGLFYL